MSSGHSVFASTFEVYPFKTAKNSVAWPKGRDSTACVSPVKKLLLPYDTWHHRKMNERRHPAILLLGPTGSGKTPLGDLLEASGFRGYRCAHLDFGANLRAIAGGAFCPGLSDSDIAVVRDSLETGALLENKNFHIARKIVDSFVAANELGRDDLVVLNGLPRHIDQADDVASILDVRLVVCLSCSKEVVLERIRLNAGGDRTGRNDDSIESVERKLQIFHDRTAPILDHYRKKGVRVCSVEVSEETEPGGIVKQIPS